MATGTLHVGTSGWTYQHWRNDFYPKGLPQRRWLSHYRQQFDTVEVNATFYGLLRPSTFTAWARDAPPGFEFALKGSRFITHIQRLAATEASLERFFERAPLLGEHLGPILWQLPPNLERDDERLGRFLEQLPREPAHAFEFRHRTWFCEPTYSLLRQHEAALCVAHRGKDTSPRVVTAPLVYVRFHGTDERYEGSYGARGVARWATRIRHWLDDGLDVYAYFNNDIGGHAPRDAHHLRDAVARRGGGV